MARTIQLTIVGAVVALGTTARAAVLQVAGSPAYDEATATGMRYVEDYLLSLSVNNSGVAIGLQNKYVGGTTDGAYHPVRWDASGTGAVELGVLGSLSGGYGETGDINDTGTAVGAAGVYAGGVFKGERAVRWNLAGTAATVLDALGTDSKGYTAFGCAKAINAAGTAVGGASKYVGGVEKGLRAVRWDASGTAATELGHLGTDNSGTTYATAMAVDASGTAVGTAQKYVNGNWMGSRAVRWNASGTAATELGTLGTNSAGTTNVSVFAINDAGTVVGQARKYVDGVDKGLRGVRWDASGTAATELGTLGTGAGGTAGACAYAINASGTAVGQSTTNRSGSSGFRAVRWDGSGTAATELGILGTDGMGYTRAEAYAINDAGTAVGFSFKYAQYTPLGSRATMWLPDASVIDLNDLGIAPVPAGGTWTLTSAEALSADGWVAGKGTFDPDGSGPLLAYDRLWVAQVGLGGKWTSATGGTWGRGNNWSTGTPAALRDATFDLNAAYSVALDREEKAKTIAITAGTVTIQFNGHRLGTESGLSVANGATLKGGGAVDSNIANAGIMAPGNSPGTLDISGDLANTGKLEFEIAGPSSHDSIHVTGRFTAGGTIVVKLLDGYVPTSGSTFDLMSVGTFANNGYAFDFIGAGLSPGLMWDASTFAATGSITVVPEPGTLAMIGGGGLALAVFAWRRRKGDYTLHGGAKKGRKRGHH